MPVQTDEIKHSHACRIAQSDFLLASDRLKRANRDLGETAAVMAASLTTITAIQAVISIAVDRLALPIDYLQLGFNIYLAIIVVIFMWGILRSLISFRKRGRAEKDIDRAKDEIFRYCPEHLWLKSEGE